MNQPTTTPRRDRNGASPETGEVGAALLRPATITSRWRRDPGVRYRVQQSAVDILVLFVIVQIASIVYGLVNPSRLPYTSTANVSIALQSIPLLGIPALGVGILMIAGEFDLSVGANLTFSSIVFAQLNASGMPVWVAALLGLLIGGGIGFLNGVITLRLRIPSFITTLGTAGLWSAATLYVHGASSQPFTSTGLFAHLTSGSIGVIPAEFVWFLAVAAVCYVLLQRHWIGNHLFAVGGNKQAASEGGVSINRSKLVAFTLAGLCAAVAGILAASRIGNIAPGGATDLPLQAIAACVIGGLTLAGGRGTILGIALGASLIYWIEDVLLLVGAPSYYLTAFVGALIIAAAALYANLRTRRA
jgi:simple sugar transport system permease protein